MILERFTVDGRPTWVADGQPLANGTTLGVLLGVSRERLPSLIESLRVEDAKIPAEAVQTAPIDGQQDVWASGVTYLQSRRAREEESEGNSIYARVYDAERPELFFKARGSAVVGTGQGVRIRRDSDWNVPEPELVAVVNSSGEVVGYTAGNDLSSRSIEGENPLYLPQAKIWDGACAVGPAIQVVSSVDEIEDLTVTMQVIRGAGVAMSGETGTSQMRRSVPELVEYLRREMALPHGALLMTGTGIVPDLDFSLRVGDEIVITVGSLTLANRVAP